MSVPPLFLDAAGWAALSRKLLDPFFAGLYEKNEKALRAYDALQGESLIDVPNDLNNALSCRTPGTHYRTIKGRLIRAAVCLHLSGSDAAWEHASRTIEFLLRRDFWRPSSRGCRIDHFDLKMGDLLYCASFALEAFRERMDAGCRERLIALMIEEGVAAYFRGWEAGEWWREAEFNWGAATHGNAGLAALALADHDLGLSERLLERAREGVAVVIDGLPLDGLWTEGAMYHTTTLGHLSDFAIALYNRRADDLGLSANPRWIEALDSRAAFLAPDGRLFNFSNCGTTLTEWYLPQAYWWAQRLNRPEWTAFEDSICKSWSDTHGVFHDVEAFLYRQAHPEPPRAATPSPLRRFRGLDWAIWRGPANWLAMRAGNNGGNHNNLDLGHFIFGRHSDRFLVDPGYGAKRTSQHNAVTIRGHYQADLATARILDCRSTAEGAYLACELQECFPHVLETHIRHLIVHGEHLFLVDAIRSRNGYRVSAQYHFQTDLGVSQESKRVRIVGREGNLYLTSLNGHSPTGISSWSHDGQQLTAMTFHRQPDLNEEISAFLLSCEPASAPACTLEAARGEIIVRSGGQSTIYPLWKPKGGNPG